MRNFVLAVCLAAIGACTTSPPPPSINEPAEVATVESALRSYDEVLTAGDTAKLRGLIAPGFRMHEDNSEMDIDGVVEAVDSVSSTGR
jgi:hypothetical protein